MVKPVRSCEVVCAGQSRDVEILRDSANKKAVNRMIAAFGSGASYSLVSGITQGNRFQGAFTTGVLFAAFQGALHKVAIFFSHLPLLPLERKNFAQQAYACNG